MIKVKDLITLEQLLLEIDDRFKFKLRFAEVIELNEFIEEISKITNMFFSLQEEYYKKYGDYMLKEYHDKLMNDIINVNASKMIGFIKDINNRYYDDGFANIITKKQFWD